MPDNEAELVQYGIEVSNASKAHTAWETFIGPYHERKMQELFVQFISAPMRDKDGLQGIKMQANALEGLKIEIMGYIETGKLAQISLDELEATRKDAKKETKDE